jgi:hypothetical protein
MGDVGNPAVPPLRVALAPPAAGSEATDRPAGPPARRRAQGAGFIGPCLGSGGWWWGGGVLVAVLLAGLR